MGKWQIRTDFFLIYKNLVVLLVYFIVVIVFRVGGRITSITTTEDGLCFIDSRILLFYQYILSFFVAAITTKYYEDCCNLQTFCFLQSLPMSIYQIWINRCIRLIAAMLFLSVPAIAVSLYQLKCDIDQCQLGVINNSYFSERAIVCLLICFITICFVVFLSLCIMLFFRNRIISCAILFSYFIMEMGPWGRFEGTWSPFYASFSSYNRSVMLMNITNVLVLCLIVSFVIIGLLLMRYHLPKTTMLGKTARQFKSSGESS